MRGKGKLPVQYAWLDGSTCCHDAVAREQGGGGGVGVVQGQVGVKRVFREIFKAVVMEAGQLAGGRGQELRRDHVEGSVHVGGVGRHHVGAGPGEA